jgi:hypothetical protein
MRSNRRIKIQCSYTAFYEKINERMLVVGLTLLNRSADLAGQVAET